MRSTVTFLLAILVAIAFVASLVSFALWLAFAYYMVTGNSVADFGAAFAPEMMEQASRTELLLMQAREYVALIGGAIGWTAFFTLPHFSGRPFRTLPRLLIASCTIGIIAAVVMAAPLVFKIAPILTVVLVFLRCALIEPRPDEVPQERASRPEVPCGHAACRKGQFASRRGLTRGHEGAARPISGEWETRNPGRRPCRGFAFCRARGGAE